MLVKELVGVGEKSSASGSGYFPGDFIGIAVSVKDGKQVWDIASPVPYAAEEIQEW